MHVGLVIYGGLDERSGGYRYDRKLVDHLRRRGDDVDVIAIPWRTYPRHLTDNVSRSLRRRLDRPFDVLLQDELCHPSLWRHNPRLEEPDAVVALVHLLRSGGPATALDPLYRRVERRYLRTLDATVCTSYDTQVRTRDLATLSSVVAHPAGRIEGVALSADRVETRAHDDPFRVLFVGNLLPRKGLLTLLSALAGFGIEHETSEADWQADIVGGTVDESYARDVERRVVELGLEERVARHGAVSDEQLRALFERADVLVVPSTYEGFGMVYLEAMEYGVVPIASAVGGAGEIVTDGVDGYLVEPDDSTAIQSILTTLCADRETLAERARNALRTADDHPDWSESMEQVREFLLGQIRADADQTAHSDRMPIDHADSIDIDGTGGVE